MSSDGKSYRGGIRKDTNSNNPNSIKARVFVGNLNNEQCTQMDLEKAFAKHGKITGCSVHKNFGFVQFDSEKSAREMVEEWHGKSFVGKRIDCNIADERRKPQQKDFFPGGPSPRSRPHSPPPPPRHRPATPPRHRTRSRSPHSRGRDRPPPGMFRREGRPSRFSDATPEDFAASDTQYPSDRHGSSSYDRPPRDNFDRESYDRQDYAYGAGFSSPPTRSAYGSDGYAEPPASFHRSTYDCEIIVLSKEQRGYGEMVEERLRRIGVKSNVVFPRPEIRVIDVIERVAKGGALYSIVLSAQNEMHHSCTLNIMHGTRQEHRNMPLEDALAFVAKHFEQYLRENEDGGGQASYQSHDYASAGTPTARKDPDIAELLVAAAAGKKLDDAQIAKLAMELKKRNAAEERSSSGQAVHQETQTHLQSMVLKALGPPKDDHGNNEKDTYTKKGTLSLYKETYSTLSWHSGAGTKTLSSNAMQLTNNRINQPTFGMDHEDYAVSRVNGRSGYE